ncbi:MAG: hypothetical protein CSA26_03305 [Desulfobacterales bacterium]|nr:MAG: hypothetical protein CSA26_03305 [Desulfobacterales bacterium]
MKYCLTEKCRVDFVAYAPMHTFKGWTTKGLSGFVDVDFSKKRLHHIEAVSLTEFFDTGYDDRNKAMVDFFDLKRNSESSFTMTECREFSDAGKSVYKVVVLGILDFAGIRRQLPLTCYLKDNGDMITLDISFKWSFKAYGIKAPRLLFLTVRDIVDISARLEFKKEEERYE